MFLEKARKELNPPQLQAVLETTKPALVLSGAGTGKTRVITYKIAYLIAEKGIRPEKIIAMTFTNKAAEEMRNRAYSLISEAIETDIFKRNLWVATFHSNCARILRIHGKILGYTPSFTIIDEDDKTKILNDMIKEKGFKHIAKASKAKADISRAKNNFLDAEDLITIGKDGNEKYYNELAILYEAYNNYLLKSNCMDFDDLIVNTVKIFYQEEEICSYWRSAFDYILVDEFQDTNKSQYLLLKLLMKKNGTNLTLVGDDDQSIYSFRGAAIENILSLNDDFKNLEIIKVVDNYRSTPEILSIANEVIAKNKNRLGKDLMPKCESLQSLPLIYYAEDDRNESYFIANEIKKILEDEPETKIAVIYRINSQSRIFETALSELRVPYAVLGSKSFYDRREIKDLLAYFRLILNPKDNLAFKRIINVPLRGIGDTTLEKLEDFANSKNCSLFEGLKFLIEENPKLEIRKGILDAIKDFYFLIEELSETSKTQPEKVFDLLLDATEYIKFIDTYGNEDERKSNIDELSRYYDSYFSEENNPKFEQFIQNLTLMDHSEEENPQEYKRVFLTTVHSCKGLEFDRVFIAGLAEEVFPHHMSVQTAEQLEEERRLFYVAATRAKKHLTLSYPKKMFRNHTYEYFYKSRFLSEFSPNSVILINPPKNQGLKNLKGFY